MFLYGPVASRRLGWSLGVDILPQSLNKCKFCTLDCVYCQLGSCKPVIPSLYEHIQPDTLLREIEQRILSFNETGSSIDYITFAGSGEPTLNSGLGDMIRIINTRFPELKVSVITNSTMLCDKNVRRNIIDADLIVPSLDCYDDESYRKINRPHSSLKFKDLFEGLINLRSEFKGLFRLEIMLVKDLNDDEESVLKISELVRQLQPFDIDINIPSRPPAEKWVLKPSDDALKFASSTIGATVLGNSSKSRHEMHVTTDNIKHEVLALLKRRPESIDAIVSIYGETQRAFISELIDNLISDGKVSTYLQDSMTYFVANE